MSRTRVRDVLALGCAGRTPLQIAAQVGLPDPVVVAVLRRAGWNNVEAMRESLARLDALSDGRTRAPLVRPGQDEASSSLDDLVTATASSRDRRVIEAMSRLQVAAAELRRVSSVAAGRRAAFLEQARRAS